ncbi:MAG: hypothetical protein H6605_08205 [Flavobacteriales bacterium]|nr:hypothetical protein [Flavobacteriales bacterium]
MTQKWEGKSKGPVWGYRFFIFLLKYTHTRVAYFLLYFVCAYYFLFAGSRKAVYHYFKNIHGYKGLKLHRSAFKNYYLFGQTLIDKFGVLTGAKKPLKMTHDGRHYLQSLAESGKGAIIVSAHIGNWEIAGNVLSGYSKINVLMYRNEREDLSQFEQEKFRKHKVNIIAVDNNSMSHILELHQTFKRGEILVMHADRFVSGGQTKSMKFMGQFADFPVGPFYLAAKFGVPICFAGAVKTGIDSCYVFAHEPIYVEKVRGTEKLQEKIDELMKLNVFAIESVLKRFPLQWFNFYPFWKNQP